MLSKKQLLISSAIVITLGASIVGANMALKLRNSCIQKVESGQTCTNCIKVEDLIERLGLDK